MTTNPFDELEGNDDDDFEMPPHPRKVIPAADLEMLRLAARAIGAELEEVDGEEWVHLHFEDGSTEHHWNPLVHGDNALNLVAKLQMQVDYSGRGHRFNGDVTILCAPDIFIAEPKSGDVYADTRRAITRAAAELGKNRQPRATG